MRLKVGKLELDVGREIRQGSNSWHAHLVMVVAGSRLLGLVESVSRVKGNEPFTLYHALSYESPQINVAMTGASTTRVSVVAPPIVIPFDTLGPAKIRVGSFEYAVVVDEQEDDRLREYFFEAYQSTFAPSRLVVPQGPTPDLITK